MTAQATPTPLTVRTKARAAVWKYLQIIGKSERKLPGVQIVVNHRVMAFNNEKALGIIKNGISSRAIDPLSEFLGIGKGEVAEYLDLDRTTALRRSTKDLPLPTHSAESVLRLLELDEIANDRPVGKIRVKTCHIDQNLYRQGCSSRHRLGFQVG